nr:MAG: polyprotein [Picornaviridae sp.]
MTNLSEKAKIEEETLSMGVTSAPSHAVRHSDLDVVRWREILCHATVLDQGTIPKTAQAGDSLFSFPVSPNTLASQTTKSLIKHLSECFQQWNGTIVFELLVTIPSFVAAKMVLAFVPGSANVSELPPAVLAGLQNSVICQASNSHRVELRVPFIAEGNWLSVTTKTGTLVAKMMETPVYAMDFNAGLPWTLFVRADPTDFNFRYITPPPQPNAPSTSNPTTSTGDPTPSDNTVALSYSTCRPQTSKSRVTKNFPLVRLPTANTALEYSSMMLIPRARVEFVMQKVRGQYPAANSNEASTSVLRMFDASTPTLSTVERLETPSLETLLPYLCNGFVWTLFGSNSSTDNVTDAFSDWCEVDPQNPVFVWSHSVNARFLIKYIFLWIPRSLVDKDVFVKNKKLWLAWDPDVHPLFECTITGIVSRLDSVTNTMQYAVQLSLNPYLSKVQSTGLTTYFSQRAVVSWKTTYPTPDTICDALRQIDSAPPEVTHLALYTTMPPELASEFCRWLTTADNTSPPMAALSYTISFSPNQSNLLMYDGRMIEDSQTATRGIIWKLFKLFKGNENAWWAWLIKGLDIIVDALIGAFLGRSDVALAIDCSPGSGFRAEAMGAYSADKLQESRSYIPSLEQYPRVAFPTLFDCMLSNTPSQYASTSRSLRLFRKRSTSRSSALPDTDPSTEPTDPTPGSSRRRYHSRTRASSSDQATPTLTRPASASPKTSRKSSRQHRAKHPSPKKAFLRSLVRK